ncbi:MAG: PorT family protein [Bacteroidetes bacterium]|nr:PorT family protein [Bacteroidota bacterium]
MRSLLIVGCALMLMSKMSSAQIKIELGLKCGLNISGLALSSDGKLVGAKYNNLNGFHGGAYGLFRLKKFAIQPEIIYSRQGQVYTTPNYSNLRTDLNYVNVPVMIKFYPVGGINIQIGPQLGFLLSAKGDLVTLSNGNVGQAILNQDLKNYLNSTDFSIAVGAGLDLPLGINIGVRYNYGVSNINKFSGGSNDTPSFSVAKTQNQVIQFSIGYRIRKIGK